VSIPIPDALPILAAQIEEIMKTITDHGGGMDAPQWKS
jgi:hypothetical protein